MSICAHIFALFREPVSDERIAAIEEIISNRTGVPIPAKRSAISEDRYPFDRFVPVPEADLNVDVSVDGILYIHDAERPSKLPGVPSLEGRLYENDTMSRHWREGSAEGPAIRFAIIMLTLLSQPDIEWVWYTDDYKEGLQHNAMTRERVHQLIDDFVLVGETSNGLPTRFVWTVNGIASI